ncbi:MAG: ImmA/IrrE family metallo-endopeptidase [Magnetococcales bacterium]|nr:ImmA/IrrE family metallo-endopeptidase [Magnetococcales bacterium]
MSEPKTPQAWANQISTLLNTVLGTDRFPVDVPEVAKEISRQRFADDPITMVKGADLPGFEGALHPAPPGKKGWGILYNSGISSQGRIRFTLAHEFGHYLLHRRFSPKGLQCGQNDVALGSLDSDEETRKRLEREADVFATYLLMPLDDFRRQIQPREPADLERLSACANRYGVSLMAAIRRWLEYTEKRAVLVVSREGFILWSQSSEPARKTRASFKTFGCDPVEIPAASLAANPPESMVDARLGKEFPCGVWFADEEVKEMAIPSEQYDFVLSLLLLKDRDRNPILEEDPEEDAYDRLMQITEGQ